MPSLYILAGPNGAGKTTFYFSAIEQNFIDKKLSYINTDIIARDELGGYSKMNFAKAEEIVRERITRHIELAESFMVESNLARQSDYDWLKAMKAKGYSIIVYFLCTSNVEINLNRISRRVKEGGHDIPENIVRDRYNMSLIYLKTGLLNCDEVFLIDNSAETAVEIAFVEKGKLVRKISGCTEWANKILYIVEKMKPR